MTSPKEPTRPDLDALKRVRRVKRFMNDVMFVARFGSTRPEWDRAHMAALANLDALLTYTRKLEEENERLRERAKHNEVIEAEAERYRWLFDNDPEPTWQLERENTALRAQNARYEHVIQCWLRDGFEPDEARAALAEGGPE